MTEMVTNALALSEAEEIQKSTKEAFHRIHQQTAETEAVAEDTLAALRQQRGQLNEIQNNADRARNSTAHTHRMLDSFDRWSGHFLGFKKRAAKVEAAMNTTALEADIARRARRRKNMVTHLSKIEEQGPPPSLHGATRGFEAKSEASFGSERIDPQTAQLDEESKQRLALIAEEDKAMDEMLDQTSASLDRLAEMSDAFRRETRAQAAQQDELEETLQEVATKQAVANSRIKRLLWGKYRKRNLD